MTSSRGKSLGHRHTMRSATAPWRPRTASALFAWEITHLTAYPGKTRSTDCTDGFMKKTVKERGKIIEEVKGCHFCTNWRHTSEQCCMQLKFTCTKLDGSVVCEKKNTTVVYTGQNLNTASQCLSTNEQKKIILLT